MGGGGTKILPLTGWFILVGDRLTPHMWERREGSLDGVRGGLPKKRMVGERET